MARDFSDITRQDVDGEPLVAVGHNGSSFMLFTVQEKQVIVDRFRQGEPAPMRTYYRPASWMCVAYGVMPDEFGPETECREEALQWVRDYIAEWEIEAEFRSAE